MSRGRPAAAVRLPVRRGSGRPPPFPAGPPG
ncbi:hypothetical protein SFR_4978 [Streptomyces sp. FR-008]|nr:hypothetical protein SFR_4978 [Streptomyces sp. FR-008]